MIITINITGLVALLADLFVQVGEDKNNIFDGEYLRVHKEDISANFKNHWHSLDISKIINSNYNTIYRNLYSSLQETVQFMFRQT